MLTKIKDMEILQIAWGGAQFLYVLGEKWERLIKWLRKRLARLEESDGG